MSPRTPPAPPAVDDDDGLATRVRAALARSVTSAGIDPAPVEEPGDEPPATPGDAIEALLADALASRAELPDEAEDDDDGDPAVEPEPPGALLLAGDLREDPDTYQAHRARLAVVYGVEGPLEEMLLDRVADLSWRLARLQRVERGAVATRTVGVRVRLGRERREAADAAAWGDQAIRGGALSHENPEHIRRVLAQLDEVRAALADGEVPPWEDTARVFAAVFGYRDDQHLRGRGDVLLSLYHPLARGLEDGDLADRLLAFFVDELRVVARVLAKCAAFQEDRAEAHDRARIEARGMARGDRLKELIAYERHLADELRHARAELDRAVSRRRLAEIAARVPSATTPLPPESA